MNNATLFVDLDGTLFEWCEGEDFKRPHYFRHLPYHSNIVKAINLLKNKINICFATAVLNEEAAEDKRLSLDELGFNDIPMIAIPYGENKDNYLKGDKRILLDDYNENLKNFKGIPIKLINKINNKNGSWKGLSIHYLDSPENIAKKILEVAGE